MSFSDPITVTVNTVAKSLVRINQDGYSSEYFLRESTQEFTVKIRNTSFLRAGQTIDRHNVELTQTVYATATAPALVRKAYTVIENSRSDVPADAVFLGSALAGFTNAANLAKMVNRES